MFFIVYVVFPVASVMEFLGSSDAQLVEVYLPQAMYSYFLRGFSDCDRKSIKTYMREIFK